MKIDLLQPDRPLLNAKWGHIVAAVQHLNSWDSDLEISWLAELATVSENHIELGAFKGASTKAMCLANPNLKITVIDLWDDLGTHETFLSAMEKEISDGRVAFYRSSTEEGCAKLKGQIFQTAFIDAGHLEHNVLADIQNCLTLVPRGIISGHDYRHNDENDGVNKAVNSLIPDRSLPVDSIWAALRPRKGGFYA
jgi:hypothetical protein